MKKILVKIITFLLITTLSFSTSGCFLNLNGNGSNNGSNNGGDNSGNGGNNPPANERVTTLEFDKKVDALQGSETLKLDSGNFGVITFKTGQDSGQTLNDKPLYVRELDTITIEGKLDETSKTTFLKTLKFETHTTINDTSVIVKTRIKTLKFKDLNFTDNIKLILNYSSLENGFISIENLEFENVSINNGDMSNLTGRHGVAIETNCGAIKNVSFLNSQVINVNSQNASGIHFNDATGMEKITIKNTKIAGINYNAVQVNKFKGELTIDECTTSFTGSRAIRIDDIKEGSIVTITNNKFEAVNSDEAFKISSVHPSTYLTISNNTLNGEPLTYDDYVIA